MNTTNVSQVSMRKSARKALVLCLFAAIAAAFLLYETAQAQEGAGYQYVDLVMTYEYDSNEVAYIVQNNGTATATGVTVSFLLEDLQTNALENTPSVIDKRTENSTNQTFIWEVGTILPSKTSGNLTFSTVNHSGHTTWNRIGVITATASSHQPEPGSLLANNVTKVYSWARSRTASTLHMSSNRLGLLLSVDDLRPDAGGDVDFDLTAENFSRGRTTINDYIDLIDDIEIKVELSDGLEFKQDWSRPTGFTTSGRSATWKPEAVDTWDGSTTPGHREIEIETQLTSDTLDEIPLEERCITARVVDSTPPPRSDYALGSLKQCLGDDPKLLFTGGELDLFTLYSCVGVTPIGYPCRDDDGDSTVDNGLEMVAGSDISSQFAPRAQGLGRNDSDSKVYLRPGSVVVQVQDPRGRVVDSSNNLAWWTRHIQGLTPTLNNSSQSSADWTQVRWEIASVERPSNGHVHLFNEPRTFKIVNTNDKTQHPVGGGLTTFAASLKVNFAVDVKFDTLGTYVVDFTQETKNNNGTTGDLTDDVDHLAKGRYTFDVGPIAELEVRDGGATPHAPAGRNALTIFAFNNGPDPSLGAQVTGLPAGAEVLHISQGSYNGTDGVWNTGELEDRDVWGPAAGPNMPRWS